MASNFFREEDTKLKEQLRGKRIKKSKGTKFLSSGNTLLNLACTGRFSGCFMEGGFFLVVGDSTSGKTALAGTCFGEACLDDYFKDHDLVFDNPENGALMFGSWFGEAMASRVKKPPLGTSRTVEKFYANVHKCTHSGRKGIYVLDSEPALSSEQEREKQAEKRDALEKDKDTTGIMTDGKAAVHSRNMRTMCADVEESGWIVIMITQTRDNMGFGAQFNPKTRPGGRALKFFAQLEMWASVRKKLTKRVRGKERPIGIIAQVQVKKNRITGKDRTVELPIYNSFGFDDLGGCIDFLIAEKHWKVAAGIIRAPEFRKKLDREELIAHIEETNQEKLLRQTVKAVWLDIEQALEVPRKSRYQ